MTLCRRVMARMIGFYLVVAIAVLVFFLFQLWPEKMKVGAPKSAVDSTTEVLLSDSTLGVTGTFDPNLPAVLTDTTELSLKVTADEETSFDTTFVFSPISTKIPGGRLLLLVAIVGALGACLHAVTSITEFVGNREFCKSWTSWYLFRPLVGAILAMLFYFVIRGGLFPQVESNAGFYGIIAVSGLIGLFSKQALYKLSELFDVLFKSEKQAKLKDRLEDESDRNPVPEIEAIQPTSVEVEATNVDIKVTGCGFCEKSVVRIDGEDLAITFESATELTVRLTDQKLATPGVFRVAVFNPEPGGGLSESRDFEVKEKQTSEEEG